MLEKIGLPPKPSMRGANWVVDASHCQGCASQFTFFNRKHHCRRCGGIFCNNCTSQRMILRGQGDAPVRICDPCKNLEEAARFELRHGQKSRVRKGGLKRVEKNEDEALNQILGTDIGSALLKSGDSSSSMFDEAIIHKGGDIIRSFSENDVGSSSPEELRQQAVEEKKKYKILNGEGKREEALQAFKRGKELERQAAALEIALRKRRKKTMVSSSSSMDATHNLKDDPDVCAKKTKILSQEVREDKDDFATQLRELGWSDADLVDTDKKPVKLSLEGELSNLLGEIRQGSSAEKKQNDIDRTQVIAHKKKALMLKREGKLAEAKEELKKAKILEKQIEEQEFLIDAEDSDDELSALIRSMDDNNTVHDEFSMGDGQDPALELNHLMDMASDLVRDDDFEVTDDDYNDPEIAMALKSFGWDEELDETVEKEALHEEVPVENEALQREILSLKREALNLKRAGKVEEAMSVLKKAKLLEQNLEKLPTGAQLNSNMQRTPQLGVIDVRNTNPPKSKLELQRELLSVKKAALALRREGRPREADEELKKAKALEVQLEELQNVPKVVATRRKEPPQQNHEYSVLGAPEAEGEDVTDQDMHDPTYLSLLKNLGWDEDVESASLPQRENTRTEHPVTNFPSVVPAKSWKSKAEIQKELLGLKRKALTLRRQGKHEEADEKLRITKVLEAQMAEMDTTSSSISKETQSRPLDHQKAMEIHIVETQEPQTRKPPKDHDEHHIVINARVNEEKANMSSRSPANPLAEVDDTENFQAKTANPDKKSSGQVSGGLSGKREEGVSTSGKSEAHADRSSVQEDILRRKRRALALKREGKVAEAREELRQAKLLEKTLDGDVSHNTEDTGKSSPQSVLTNTHSVQESQKDLDSKPLSGRDRFKLQQQCLAHKRQALKLRREGKIQESEAESELARAIEAQLEESSAPDSDANSNKGNPEDDLVIENFLDPQLLSALKAVGLHDAESSVLTTESSAKMNVGDTEKHNQEEERRLLEQIKAEKLQALELKRSGNQAEALNALRRAKQLEKKLNSLGP